MKVYISKDEWYPCYGMELNDETLGKKSELTQEEYEFANKSIKNFNKARYVLEKAYNKGESHD